MSMIRPKLQLENRAKCGIIELTDKLANINQ